MDVQRKEKLGAKWVCYSCGARFYDLGKPEPLCPKCEADQREGPLFAKKSARPRPRKAAKKAKVEVARLPDLDTDDGVESKADEDSDKVRPIDVELDASEVTVESSQDD